MKFKELIIKTRKIFALTLAISLFASVAACGKGGDDSVPSSEIKDSDNTTSEIESVDDNVDYNLDYDTVIGELVKNNKSEYSIVYGANAGLAVLQAAKEIQDFVLKATGVFVKATTDEGVKYTKNSKILSLGQNDILRQSGISTDFSLLKNDGYFIKTDGKSIFLTGKTDKGTLYSAYEFLERFVGVRYLTYDYTYVPELDEIEIYASDITDNPAFNDRTLLSNKVMTTGQFASRMRMVNEFVVIDERYGGGLGWFNDSDYISNYVHSTLSYVSPDKYYAAHPDWFFVQDGRVLDLHYSNLGITADGHVDQSLSQSAVKVAIESLKTFILNSADNIKYFMVGQMDEHAACNCAKCQADVNKYKRSGMNIRFVNAMSEEIEKWMKAENINREIYICTFAYQYSQSAPVDDNGNPLDSTVIPRDNVIVRIAPIQANNYYSMTDERQNERTRNMFLEWTKVAKKTMIWDYHEVFSHYFGYYPTMQAWQENLNLYRNMGAEYVFMQVNHSEVNDFKALMETYVASKMLWNPNRNANELRQEYIKYYYDGMGDLVNEFIDNFEINYYYRMNNLASDDGNTNQDGYKFMNTQYYSVAFFDGQFALIEKMYKRADELGLSGYEKERFVKKVDMMKLYPLYMVLYNYDSYYFNDTVGKKAMLKEFFTLCNKLGVTQYAENKTISALKKSWGYEG